MTEGDERVRLCLLGTAVGDAVGLARENLSARRAARLFSGELRPQLLPGWGVVSDDAEHACMAAQAFCASGGSPDLFRKDLARRLRWWIASLPPGVGLATARSCLKLWAGVSPARSGARSAGNGPLMRAPVLGVLGRDPEHVRAVVDASTLITHRDDRAVEGARIIAAMTHAISRSHVSCDADLFAVAREARVGEGTESWRAVERAFAVGAAGTSVEEFARRECGDRAKGVSGYVVHTLGCSVFAWRRHRADAQAGITAIVRCGGDTDSTAALVGALYGAEGMAMPDDWASRVRDWPRSMGWIGGVGDAAAACSKSGCAGRAPSTPPGACLIRNALLLGLVVGHVVRRALPPY